MIKKSLLLFIFILLKVAAYCQADNNATVYHISPGKIKANIEPTMYGIFFEDSNQAADGGVYAELVKNRSFEFKMPLMGWKPTKKNDGSVLVLNRGKASE